MPTVSPQPIDGTARHSWANEVGRLLAGTAIPLTGLGAAALMISGLLPGVQGGAWRLYVVASLAGALTIGVAILIKRMRQGSLITTDPMVVRREGRRSAAVPRVTIPIGIAVGFLLSALLRGNTPLALGVVGVISGLTTGLMLFLWFLALRLKAVGWFEPSSSTGGISATTLSRPPSREDDGD